MKKKNIDDIEIIDDEKPKRKLKKKSLLLLLIPLIVVGGVIGFVVINNQNKQKRLEEERKLLEEIKSHYGEYVKVTEKTSLLVKKDDKYEEEMIVYPDVILELDELEPNVDTKYFKLKNNDYYIDYHNIEKDSKEDSDNRYKNYIPFNENIVTKDKFTLFDGEKEAFSFNKSMEFPIIINDYEDKYYIEYHNKLLNISKDDVKETKKASNTEKKNQSKITTLAYHQVEDEGVQCKDLYVCINKENFDKEMKYLKDNNYFTLTMEELYMYLNGNIQVEKGIVLTFDDGYKAKSTIEILEKYDLMGTIFVITKSFDNMDSFKSDNLFVQSHTHNMHRNYVCPGGSQGGAILCSSEKEIKDDLKLSIEKTGEEPWAMAYPFYDYNEKALKAVKDVGFKMSFVGRAGVMGKATPKVTNLYKIPRMTVWDLSIMSFSEWKSYL